MTAPPAAPAEMRRASGADARSFGAFQRLDEVAHHTYVALVEPLYAQAPDGLLSHTSWRSAAGNTRAFDVWETEEARDRFEDALSAALWEASWAYTRARHRGVAGWRARIGRSRRLRARAW